jgi:hypothetical protein
MTPMTSSPTNLFLLSAAIFFWAQGPALAFEVLTHEDITQRALLEPPLGMVSILTRLGFGHHVVAGKPDAATIGAFRDGSNFEDGKWKLSPRPKAHFHDPTRPADQAGLQLPSPPPSPEFPPFISAAFWAQDVPSGHGGALAVLEDGNDKSWGHGRQAMVDALTKADPGDRESRLSDTFVILGHLAHLVQDMAAPAHTRNDIHIAPEILDPLQDKGLVAAGLKKDGFHGWAFGDDVRARIRGDQGSSPYDVMWPEDTIDGCTVYDVAPVPISCLIDTGKYYESIVQNPQNFLPSDARNIGLAEYSNANFFSEDSLFDSYPFPRADQVELGPLEEWPTAGPNDPPEDKWRRYLIKNGPGEVIAHLAVPTALWEFLPEGLRMRKLKLDDRVFEDYGELLLPRAIGYSAALIDYFFRGKIDLIPDPDTPGAYIVRNLGDEVMDGTVRLFYDDANGTRHEISEPGWRVTLQPKTDASDEDEAVIMFSEPTLPPAAKPGEYILVFQGQLGLEGDPPSETNSLQGDPSSETNFAIAGAAVKTALCETRVMELGSFDSGAWQPYLDSGGEMLDYYGRIVPGTDQISWEGAYSDWYDRCTIDYQWIGNHKTYYYLYLGNDQFAQELYDPPFSHYENYRIGPGCGVRVEADVVINGMGEDDSGYVGGEIFPFNATPQVIEGVERPDLPPVMPWGPHHRGGFGGRTTWGVRSAGPTTPLEQHNGQNMFEWEDWFTYPSPNGTHHVYAELAWSSTDPITGESLQWEGSTFVPGKAAMPFWVPEFPYLGIAIEATNFDVEGACANPIARLENVVVTVFPLEDPPILTEDD